MPEFLYSARDGEGYRHRGKIEAADRAAAEQMLAQQFVKVTQLDEVAELDNKQRLQNLLTPVSGEDLLGFCQALASMFAGGISVKRVMDILIEDIEHPTLRRKVSELATDISNGHTLSAAMGRHPDVFDQFFRSMVKAGEQSGNLPEMLRRLADYIQKSETIKAKVKAALTYPAILIIFSFLLITTIMAIGVPYIDQIYGGLGLQLHWATSVVVTVGSFLARNLTWLVILLGIVGYGFSRYLQGESGAKIIDTWKLKVPVLKDLYRLLYTARFSRTLATLYASGIQVMDSLELAADTVGNRVVGDEILAISPRVEGGEALSSCLRESPHFTRLAIGMFAAGEESGNIDQMLHKVADFYELKVYSALESFASVIEPAIMVVVGLLVAGIIIVMGLPFLQMSGLG